MVFITPAIRSITPAKITQPEPLSSSAGLIDSARVSAGRRTVPGSLLIFGYSLLHAMRRRIADSEMLPHLLRGSVARIG